MIKLFSSYHPARSRLANPSTACGHRPINSPSLSPIRSAQELLYANEFHTGHLCQWFRRRLHQRKRPHKLLDPIFLNNQHHARQCLPFQTSARQGRRIIRSDPERARIASKIVARNFHVTRSLPGLDSRQAPESRANLPAYAPSDNQNLQKSPVSRTFRTPAAALQQELQGC